MRYLDQHTFDLHAEFYRDVHIDPGAGTFIKLNTWNEGDASGAANLEMQSGSSENGPLINLHNTNSDDKGSSIKFHKDKTPADDDVPGIINFDSYAAIVGAVYDASDTEGGIQLSVVSGSGLGAAHADFWGNSFTSSGTLIGNVIKGYGNGLGVVNVDLALGAASTTTIAGDLSVTTGLILDSVDITAIQTAGESFVDNDTSLMTSAAIDDRINAAAGGGLSFDGSTANGLLTYKDADEITVESSATYDGADLTLTSGTSAKPVLTLENSNTDAVAPILQFTKTATGANADEIGMINFIADDNADNPTTFAQIKAEIQDAANTSEDGQLELLIAQGGSLANVLKANSNLGVGTVLEFGDGNLFSITTFKSAVVGFESATSTAPIFSIENQTNDANGPGLTFIKDRNNTGGAGSTSDGDNLGIITFRGFDSGGGVTDYAEFAGTAVETDASNEAGKAQITVMSDGQVTQRNVITGTGHTTTDKVDIDLGYGSASTVTVPGFISIGGHTINDIDVAGEFVDSDEHLMTAAAINDQFGGGGVTSDPFSTTVIKVLPNQWIINDDVGRPLFVEDDTSNTLGVRCFSTTDEMYAWQKIPSGYKATHVQVHASASTSSAVTVGSYNYQTGANNAVASSGGDLNANIDITDIPSSATQDLVIKVSPGSGSTIVYGATVTIATI